MRVVPHATPQAITPEWAWGQATGAGLRIAVIDSGIDATHPALDGCVERDDGVALHLSADGSVVERPGPHDDLFGHGTACAGIIHSLAPRARITSVRAAIQTEPLPSGRSAP
jgi:subtilisin